jgi:F0F1-type ATP synthase membrane subunit c/vacuolar-type H+-ATPase subunit K
LSIDQIGYFRELQAIKRWLGASIPVGLAASGSATVDRCSWGRLFSAMGRQLCGRMSSITWCC